MKLVVKNVYLIEYGDNHYQSYNIELELMDDTLENRATWNDFFFKIDDGEPVTITIERPE